VQEFQLTHEQAAQAVGRSRSAASNLLRLLQLAEPVQQMLLAGDLDMGHARALLGLAAGEQVMAAQEVAARKLSVRDTEKLVARQQAEPRRVAARTPAAAAPAREIARLEERLSDKLTAPVQIRVKRRTRRGEEGEIAIAFASLDELNGVLERLGLGAE
jgi:ParB family transcriptional regulator, chromosome partitioning protein